jgi:Uma2 family endonuclease
MREEVMATVAETTISSPETVAELIVNLGGIPLERVLVKPPLGSATEEDVIAAWEGPKKRLCELVDGVLVEKAMGTRESLFAGFITRVLGNFVDEADLGIVLGADGMLRLAPGLIRIPDVSFIPWERIPGEEVSDDPIAAYVPDLAVEVLSPSNTRGEIDRKLREYFDAGTSLVWVIQPKTQTAQAYTSPTDFRRIPKTGSLHGDPVLPGFVLSLPDLFSRTRSRRKRKK